MSLLACSVDTSHLPEKREFMPCPQGYADGGPRDVADRASPVGCALRQVKRGTSQPADARNGPASRPRSWSSPNCGFGTRYAGLQGMVDRGMGLQHARLA